MCLIYLIPNIVNEIKELNKEYECSPCNCNNFFHGKIKPQSNNQTLNIGFVILITSLGGIKFESF